MTRTTNVSARAAILIATFHRLLPRIARVCCLAVKIVPCRGCALPRRRFSRVGSRGAMDLRLAVRSLHARAARHGSRRDRVRTGGFQRKRAFPVGCEGKKRTVSCCDSAVNPAQKWPVFRVASLPRGAIPAAGYSEDARELGLDAVSAPVARLPQLIAIETKIMLHGGNVMLYFRA